MMRNCSYMALVLAFIMFTALAYGCSKEQPKEPKAIETQTQSAGKQNHSEPQYVEFCGQKLLTTVKTITCKRYERLDNAVLSSFTELRELELDDVTPGIEYAEKLKRLTINGASQSAFRNLPKLRNLKYLRVKVRGFPFDRSDVTPLGEISNLEHLYFEGRKLPGMETIGNLSKLKTLHIRAHDANEYKFVKTLVALEELILMIDEIDSLEPFGNLKNLRVLALNNTTSVKDLKPLSKLKHLEELKIPVGPVELSPLAALTKLHRLDLSLSDGLKDLGGLASLKNLEYLNLSGNELSDLRPLKGLLKLKELNLDYVGLGDAVDPDDDLIVDLRPLTRLENLERLHLNQVAIKDCSVLDKLPKLEPKWRKECVEN